MRTSIHISIVDRYELKAAAFNMLTGIMAPGKDPPPGSNQPPYEERFKAWEEWTDKHNDVLNALIDAIQSELP
jgi:hypothetical protein